MPTRELAKALSDYRSGITNQQPLRYAPWVLNLLLIILVKDRLGDLTPPQWMGLSAALLGMPMLAGWARSALRQQKRNAESEILRLLRQPQGVAGILEIRATDRRLGGIKLSADLERVIVLEVRSLDAEKERKRLGRDRARVARQDRVAQLS